MHKLIGSIIFLIGLLILYLCLILKEDDDFEYDMFVTGIIGIVAAFVWTKYIVSLDKVVKVI